MAVGRHKVYYKSFMNLEFFSLRFPVADADFCGTAIDVSAVAALDVITLDEKSVLPGTGRNPTATLNNAGASDLEMTLLFKGEDYGGQYREVTVTGVSKANGLREGATWALKKIDEVSIASIDAGTPAAGDVLDIGYGKICGLPIPVSDVSEVTISRLPIASSVAATPTLSKVATSSEINITYNTLEEAVHTGSAPTGAEIIELCYQLTRNSPDDRYPGADNPR